MMGVKNFFFPHHSISVNNYKYFPVKYIDINFVLTPKVVTVFTLSKFHPHQDFHLTFFSMSFIKTVNMGKWMFTWPPVVLFIYSQSFTTLPLTVKIVGEIVVPFELKNAVSNYPHQDERCTRSLTILHNYTWDDVFFYFVKKLLMILHS